DDAERVPVPDVAHDSAHGSPEYLSDNVHVVSVSVKELLSALTRRGPHRVLRGNLGIAGQPGVVYTPESGRGLPAVAFGHSWLTGVNRYREFLEHLASWGIGAAAPD